MAYCVWLRNDGHINSSVHPPRNWKTSAGGEVTFEILRTFEDWDHKIVEFILEERAKRIVH